MADRRSPFKLPTRRPRQSPKAHPPEPAPEVSMEPRSATSEAPVEQSVVDAAIYRDGRRIASPATVAETARHLREQPGTMAWIGLLRPAEAQFLPVAEEFGLHHVAVEDAIVAHQRPKLERYDETLFVVLRAARYLDDVEEVDFGEIHIFVGPNFVLTVRHSQAPNLAAVRLRMEADPDFLAHGPEAVLYAILDSVVDGYAPVVAGLQKDIDEIEFQRSVRPLLGVLAGLASGFDKYGTDEELQRHLRDVADHATTVAERVDVFRQLLADILMVNATLVGQAQNEEIKALTEASYAQNEEVKRVSAWAAILFAPTLIGTIYGMNFEGMPELGWDLGYPFALGLMILTSVSLWLIFRARGWL
jgi:magnesium transporter